MDFEETTYTVRAQYNVTGVVDSLYPEDIGSVFSKLFGCLIETETLIITNLSSLLNCLLDGQEINQLLYGILLL